MKKFLLGFVCGGIFAGSTAVYAADSIQALLFPAKVTFHMNGETKELTGDQTSILNYNNRTYIPLRAFSESMGSTVNYSDTSGPKVDVYVGTAPQPSPDQESNSGPKVINSNWNFHQYDSIGTRIYGSPINPYLRIDNDNYTLGEKVQVDLRMTNIDDKPLTFKDPTSIDVQVERRMPDGSLQVIWSGKVSGLTSDPLPKAGSMQTQFQWDQKDLEGNPVPPGEYNISIKVPSSITYTMDGKTQVQSIDKSGMGFSNKFYIQ